MFDSCISLRLQPHIARRTTYRVALAYRTWVTTKHEEKRQFRLGKLYERHFSTNTRSRSLCGFVYVPWRNNRRKARSEEENRTNKKKSETRIKSSSWYVKRQSTFSVDSHLADDDGERAGLEDRGIMERSIVMTTTRTTTTAAAATAMMMMIVVVIASCTTLFTLFRSSLASLLCVVCCLLYELPNRCYQHVLDAGLQDNSLGCSTIQWLVKKNNYVQL